MARRRFSAPRPVTSPRGRLPSLGQRPFGRHLRLLRLFRRRLRGIPGGERLLQRSFCRFSRCLGLFEPVFRCGEVCLELLKLPVLRRDRLLQRSFRRIPRYLSLFEAAFGCREVCFELLKLLILRRERLLQRSLCRLPRCLGLRDSTFIGREVRFELLNLVILGRERFLQRSLCRLPRRLSLRELAFSCREAGFNLPKLIVPFSQCLGGTRRLALGSRQISVGLTELLVEIPEAGTGADQDSEEQHTGRFQHRRP